MSITLKIKDSLKTIENNVNIALVELVNDQININLTRIFNNVKLLIPRWIKKQPEIISILSTEPTSLAGQFGFITNADMIVNNIINSVINATEIKFIKYNKNFNGGLELRFQPSNFANLLALPDGHTVYKGGDLHWLDWLLKRGDNMIISNYQYNPRTGLGRSGLGNMVGGGSFRIPPQFSGTIDNNFITRSFIGNDQEKEIFYIIEKTLQ